MMYCLIPKPAEQEARPGSFRLDSTLCIVAPPTVRDAAEALAAALRKLTASPVPVIVPNHDGRGRQRIVFAEGEATGDNAEGYTLTIEPTQITLEAGGAAGAFYAAQSIVQLVAAALHDDRRIPCGVIRDTPRFAWRGLMLDSARHFQPLPWIKRLIDQMAALKLNTFHWHLNDDQGWRAEIKRYPRLTDVAAWRGAGEHRYGGFYTQAEMRELVAYAAAHHIQVVPEVEMPGHCNAALYAHPELSCTGEPFEVGDRGWDAYTRKAGRRAFCAGRAATFEFLQHVLGEIADVFDPPYLHLGGDERPNVWESCPRCRSMLTQHGLPNETHLQAWFMRRVSDYCRQTLGRQPIAWVDSLEPGLPDGLIAQGWHAGEAAAAARLGAKTINSNHEWTYFDYPALDRDKASRPDWMIVLPIEKVYHFDPIPDGLEPSLHASVLGSEAAMWTEYTPDEAELTKQLVPRLVAFSETLWSPAWGRSFDEFALRLAAQQRTGMFELEAAPTMVTA